MILSKPEAQFTISYHVRFQLLTATCMKMGVFWNVVPCSLVDTDRRFRGAYCLHHQDEILTDVSEVLTTSIIRSIVLMMEAVSTSESSVSIYQTTRRNIPEDSHLHFDLRFVSWHYLR
jgi:hypothetical protein